MKSNKSDNIKKSLIAMGKRHRILIPIAFLGLILVSVFSSICIFRKIQCKQCGLILFLLCFFILGNSFAFPILLGDNSFVSNDIKDKTDFSVTESNIILAVDDESNPMDVLQDEEDGPVESEDVDEFQVATLEEVRLSIQNSDKANSVPKITESETKKESQNSFFQDDWKLILINKQHPIPDDYDFELGKLSGRMECDNRIIDKLLLMMEDAKKEGILLKICSPYRDTEKQEKLFDKKISKYIKNGYSYMDAYKLAGQAVTVPGASEHQVGLALDIISSTYKSLNEGFGETKAGIWLKDHCYEYGFLLRYPKGKEYITGIEYEPWHFRYVGEEAANIISEKNICLEEFWDKYVI